MAQGTSKMIVRGGRLLWATPGRTVPVVRGGEGPTGVLDRQIEELRAEIRNEEAEAARKKGNADGIRDRAVEAGRNPLIDDDLFDEYDGITRESDSHRQRSMDLRARLENVLASHAGSVNDRSGGHPGPSAEPLNRAERREFAQIARRFLDSEVYKRTLPMLKNGSAHLNTDPVDVLERVELMDGLRQRTTVNVSTGGALVPIDQQLYPPVQIPVRQVRLLDLISMMTTESDMVSWVQQTVRQDVATETPYGSPAPEADYEFALRQASVKRIPQFIPATKDVLADQGQLQGLLEQDLMTGVRLGLETRFLAGTGANGTDIAFQGILNAPGIGLVTMGDAGHATEYELDAIHRAITVIRLTLFSDPTNIGLHPTTYENVVLKKDNQGRYLYPVGTETDTIWGLGPVISPVFAVGAGLVGDYRQGARMWLRDGLSVTASTEHEDFFTRGMVAILAEMRAAFAVVQPRAFTVVAAIT